MDRVAPWCIGTAAVLAAPQLRSRQRQSAAAAAFLVTDPADCPLLGSNATLEYRRLYNGADGVVGICWQGPGFDHAAHWHRAPELIYCLGGEARTLVGPQGGGAEGLWAAVEDGQCIVPAAMVAHRTKTEAGMHFDCLYFFPDGPQENREYFHRHDSPSEAAAAGEACQPHVSPTRIHDLDLRTPGWYQLVDTADWSAAVVVLPLPLPAPADGAADGARTRCGRSGGGEAAIDARGHQFCYVLHGRISITSCRPGAAASQSRASASQSQLVVVRAHARPHWRMAAEAEASGRELPRVLVCGPKQRAR